MRVFLGLVILLAGCMPATAESRWRPEPGLTWQWQLSGELATTVDADVYDIDWEHSGSDDVATLHEAGRRVICYVNVGAYEEFRPDAAKFPAQILGEPLAGWAGERWLDIRRWDLLGPLLRARMDTCRDKGFDGIEPDNVDGYRNGTGFPLTKTDQLAFLNHLIEYAHDIGLAIGLKNTVELADELVSDVDFAVNEECARYRECLQLNVFIETGKPVFHVEYAETCPQTGFSTILKHKSLDAWRKQCPS